MFDLIDNKKYRLVLLCKYTFQLIITPLMTGILVVLPIFMVELMIKNGFENAVKSMSETSMLWIIPISGWSGSILLGSFITILANLLSIKIFISLILDCLSKKVFTKKIKFVKFLSAYELQGARNKKRFFCDTFSRKKNMEIFIYDENKKKYRLFWNENYSTVKDVPDEFFDSKQLRITYFKYSRIICDVEILDQNE